MEKTGFELKASAGDRFQTFKPDGSGELVIETGQVYVTGDPNEIALLQQQDALKETDAPEGARSKSKVEKES